LLLPLGVARDVISSVDLPALALLRRFGSGEYFTQPTITFFSRHPLRGFERLEPSRILPRRAAASLCR